MKYTLVGKKTGLEIPVTKPDAVRSDPPGWWASMEEEPGDRWFGADSWDLVTDQKAAEVFDELQPGDRFTIDTSASLGYYIKLDHDHIYWVNNREPEFNNVKERTSFLFDDENEDVKITKMDSDGH